MLILGEGRECEYSYICVLPNKFLLKSFVFVFKLILKEISQADPQIYEYSPHT